jgi:hypothetical protein
MLAELAVYGGRSSETKTRAVREEEEPCTATDKRDAKTKPSGCQMAIVLGLD